jgi:cation diffusion facilitator CzcD-associated flavoprotein CzcO
MDPYKNTLHYTIMDIYNTIIVGGGISGLYAGWLIVRKYPKHRLLILEKERYLGGLGIGKNL